RLARQHLAHAVGAEAPDAVARDAVEAAVVDLAQREDDVEVPGVSRPDLHLRQIFKNTSVRRKSPSLDALEQRLAGLAHAELHDLGEVRTRDALERLQHPARLQRGVGDDADAQTPGLRTGLRPRRAR